MNRPGGVAGVLIVLVGGALLVAFLAAVPEPVSPSVDTPWIGPPLWEERGLDLVSQGLVILAGVLGVLLVLGARRESR